MRETSTITKFAMHHYRIPAMSHCGLSLEKSELRVQTDADREEVCRVPVWLRVSPTHLRFGHDERFACLLLKTHANAKKEAIQNERLPLTSLCNAQSAGMQDGINTSNDGALVCAHWVSAARGARNKPQIFPCLRNEALAKCAGESGQKRLH